MGCSSIAKVEQFVVKMIKTSCTMKMRDKNLEIRTEMYEKFSQRKAKLVLEFLGGAQLLAHMTLWGFHHHHHTIALLFRNASYDSTWRHTQTIPVCKQPISISIFLTTSTSFPFTTTKFYFKDYFRWLVVTQGQVVPPVKGSRAVAVA